MPKSVWIAVAAVGLALTVITVLWKGTSSRSEAAIIAQLQRLADDGQLDDAAELLTTSGRSAWRWIGRDVRGEPRRMK